MISVTFSRYVTGATQQNVMDATPSLRDKANRFLQATTLEEKKKWLTEFVLETDDAKIIAKIKVILDEGLAAQNARKDASTAQKDGLS